MRGLKTTGDDVSQLVLYVLRTSHGFQLEDIAKDPVRLGEGLKAILGESRARIVIERILVDAINHPSPAEYYSRFMKDLKAYKESLPSESGERNGDGYNQDGIELNNVPGRRPGGIFHASFKGLPPDFTQKMVGAVIRGLSPLGDTGREASIYLLERQYNVKVTEALTNPKRFLSGLTKMFGLGTQYLESSIIDEITNAFGLSARPVSLSAAVKEAGRKYRREEKGSK